MFITLALLLLDHNAPNSRTATSKDWEARQNAGPVDPASRVGVRASQRNKVLSGKGEVP